MLCKLLQDVDNLLVELNVSGSLEHSPENSNAVNSDVRQIRRLASDVPEAVGNLLNDVLTLDVLAHQDQHERAHVGVLLRHSVVSDFTSENKAQGLCTDHNDFFFLPLLKDLKQSIQPLGVCDELDDAPLLAHAGAQTSQRVLERSVDELLVVFEAWDFRRHWLLHHQATHIDDTVQLQGHVQVKRVHQERLKEHQQHRVVLVVRLYVHQLGLYLVLQTAQSLQNCRDSFLVMRM